MKNIKTKISRFEFAIMQVADPKEVEKYEPYTEEEEIQIREKKILETAKLIVNKNKDLTSKETIDVVGNCANCGVEFHIHKEVFEKDELLSNLMLKATKLSETDSYNRKILRLDKLQELLTNEILK